MTPISITECVQAAFDDTFSNESPAQILTPKIKELTGKVNDYIQRAGYKPREGEAQQVSENFLREIGYSRMFIRRKTSENNWKYMWVWFI